MQLVYCYNKLLKYTERHVVRMFVCMHGFICLILWRKPHFVNYIAHFSECTIWADSSILLILAYADSARKRNLSKQLLVQVFCRLILYGAHPCLLVNRHPPFPFWKNPTPPRSCSTKLCESFSVVLGDACWEGSTKRDTISSEAGGSRRIKRQVELICLVWFLEMFTLWWFLEACIHVGVLWHFSVVPCSVPVAFSPGNNC